MPIFNSQILVPADVPAEKKYSFKKNFALATKNTKRFFLLAGDQKIEHLNDDFYDGGDKISLEDNHPEHLWKIAKDSNISCLAVHPGQVARYGLKYPTVPLLIKMNGKSNLVKTNQAEPFSATLADNKQIHALQERGLKILALGYTIFLGSEREAEMLKEASHVIFQAHQAGLLAVLWIYPRGKAVVNELSAHLIAGATGLANSLGADFVKVNYPDDHEREKAFKEVVASAGNTGVIVSGGDQITAEKYLETLQKQLEAGAAGPACGRNLHQRPLKEALALTKAISAMVFEKKTLDQALNIYKNSLY